MTKTKFQVSEFTALAFTKIRNGSHDVGVCLMGNFHRLLGVQDGDEVFIREVRKGVFHWRKAGGACWSQLKTGTPI